MRHLIILPIADIEWHMNCRKIIYTWTFNLFLYLFSAFFLWIKKYYILVLLIYLIVILFLTEGEHDHFHLEGLMESPSANDDGDCFSPLLLNATSVKIEVYYNKAVNYTLMVTFVSFNHEHSYRLMSLS